MKEKFYERTHQNKALSTEKLKKKEQRLGVSCWQKRVYHHN